MLTPVYDNMVSMSEPVSHKEEWVELFFPDHDAALTYWGARFLAWRLKLKLEQGKLIKSEETIYERKGYLDGKS